MNRKIDIFDLIYNNDFGCPCWECQMTLMSEDVINSEINNLLEKIQIPFNYTIKYSSGITINFYKLTNDDEGNNEFIINIQILPQGCILIFIKKIYTNDIELNNFKEELRHLLFYKFSYYFYIQNKILQMDVAVFDTIQYLSRTNTIMYLSNKATNTITKKEFKSIIHNAEYNSNKDIISIYETYGTNTLFENGNGLFWLYFIWFDRNHISRKDFIKYYYKFSY